MLRWMVCGMAVLLAGASAVQATLVDFESPPYTAGNSVNGIDGWTVTAGTATVQNTNVLAGAQSLALSGATVKYAFARGTQIDDTTIVSWRNKMGWGSFNVYFSDNLPAGRTPFGIERYLYNATVSTFPAHYPGLPWYLAIDYRMGMIINFTSQNFRVFIENADGSNRLEAGPYGFYAYTDIINARTKGGLFIINNGEAVIDNLQIVPEPATISLLIAGVFATFLARKR